MISNTFWKEVLLDKFRIVRFYKKNSIKVLIERVWFDPNIFYGLPSPTENLIVYY